MVAVMLLAVVAWSFDIGIYTLTPASDTKKSGRIYLDFTCAAVLTPILSSPSILVVSFAFNGGCFPSGSSFSVNSTKEILGHEFVGNLRILDFKPLQLGDGGG